jgi:hypothetical protein
MSRSVPAVLAHSRPLRGVQFHRDVEVVASGDPGLPAVVGADWGQRPAAHHADRAAVVQEPILTTTAGRLPAPSRSITSGGTSIVVALRYTRAG